MYWYFDWNWCVKIKKKITKTEKGWRLVNQCKANGANTLTVKKSAISAS